jgi:hypothetical protein
MTATPELGEKHGLFYKKNRSPVSACLAWRRRAGDFFIA